MRLLRRSPRAERPSRAPSPSDAPDAARRPLLDAREERQLERLSLVSLQAVLASISGQRPSAAGAAGLEFADYRPYTPGDDLRYVDWNIRARLGELLVKVAPEERRAEMDVLIDMSRSMDFGRPNKLWHARRLAAALGAVALLHYDSVRVYGLADSRVQAGERLDSPGMVGALGDQVAGLRAGIQTDLPGAVRAYRRLAARPDQVVLITDALVSPAALIDALSALGGTEASVAVLHVLDPSEQRSPARGSLELRDGESGRALTLMLGADAAASYAQLAERFRAGVERSVRAASARYLPAPTDVEPLDLLAAGARAEGLIAS